MKNFVVKIFWTFDFTSIWYNNAYLEEVSIVFAIFPISSLKRRLRRRPFEGGGGSRQKWICKFSRFLDCFSWGGKNWRRLFFFLSASKGKNRLTQTKKEKKNLLRTLTTRRKLVFFAKIPLYALTVKTFIRAEINFSTSWVKSRKLNGEK